MHLSFFKMIFTILTGLVVSFLPISVYAVKVMTIEEVVSVVSSVGFPPPIVPIMACIAHHESSFRPNVLNYNRNDTIDYGFLQVNTIWLKTCHDTPTSILNVYNNAKCALVVYHEQGLTAWVTFNKFRSECLSYKVNTNIPLTESEQNYLVLEKKEML